MAGTEATPRKVGSRWYDARPEGEELAKWFVDDVPLHEGLDPTRYISGVTLIQQTERRKVTRLTDTGQPFQADVDELVFTPYAKVETRVLYWHDYLNDREGDVVGAIEPGPVGHVSQEGLYSMHLPEGFFVQAARDKDGKVSRPWRPGPGWPGAGSHGARRLSCSQPFPAHRAGGRSAGPCRSSGSGR